MELLRRKRTDDALLEMAFAQQREFILDQSPLQVLQCTRRAGKSFGVGLKLIRTCQKIPSCNVLYISKTRETARRIMKKDVLDVIFDHLKVPTSFNGSTLCYTLPNASQLYLLGMDADERQKKKALGGKYAGIDVDEAQDFETDTEDLIMRMLKPAVADFNGWIAMSGTPSDNVFSFFKRASVGDVAGWSKHSWSTFDNPEMSEKWAREIADLKSKYPNLETLPWYRQMYLNEWVIDSEKLVYKFKGRPNVTESLPEGKFYRVLGIDLGWDDPTSFSLLAYRDYDRRTYVEKSYKRAKMLLSDVEREIKLLHELYPNITHIVIDNAAKQAVEELSHRLGMKLIPAEKAGKYDFIQTLNSELQTGHLVLVDDATKELQDEWQTLTWDDKALEKGVHKERDACHNHCADGVLYAFRFTYSYVERQAEPKQPTTDEEHVEQWLKEEARIAEAESRREWWETETI